MREWEPDESDLDHITVERFSLAERVQHIVLIASFTVLIITGLPLLIPGVDTSWLEGAFAIRTFLHRFAATVLISLSVFHVAYVLFTDRGRGDFGHIMPRVDDIRDVLHHFRYRLGKVDEPPPFDRFDPFEKFEYFAVVWGSVIMIVTGLMMWFIEITLQIFPLWVYNLTLLIHGYEGLLAFLAITCISSLASFP
jgi:cytochrome b subunit of formate dehydrogenase